MAMFYLLSITIAKHMRQVNLMKKEQLLSSLVLEVQRPRADGNSGPTSAVGLRMVGRSVCKTGSKGVP